MNVPLKEPLLNTGYTARPQRICGLFHESNSQMSLNIRMFGFLFFPSRWYLVSLMESFFVFHFFAVIEHPLHALVSAGQTIYMDCGDLYIQVQTAVFGGLQSTGVCTALQYPDQECPESVDAENQLLPLCEGKHYCSVSRGYHEHMGTIAKMLPALG